MRRRQPIGTYGSKPVRRARCRGMTAPSFPRLPVHRLACGHVLERVQCAAISPLLNARFGGYLAFVAADVAVHGGNLGLTDPSDIRVGWIFG
jgi:hypothetical protein